MKNLKHITDLLCFVVGMYYGLIEKDFSRASFFLILSSFPWNKDVRL